MTPRSLAHNALAGLRSVAEHALTGAVGLLVLAAMVAVAVVVA